MAPADADRLTFRISVWPVVASCLGALLAIGATILAEGDSRGKNREKIEHLETWQSDTDDRLGDLDKRINRIDNNVQWIRGKMGGGIGE